MGIGKKSFKKLKTVEKSSNKFLRKVSKLVKSGKAEEIWTILNKVWKVETKF